MTLGGTVDEQRARPVLLFVINEAYFLLSHRRAVLEAAIAAGFHVHVAAPPHHAWAPAGFLLSDLAAAGVTVHPVPLSRRGMNVLTELRTLWSLVRLYRSLRPNLVHHVTIKPNLYGGIAARLTGVPAVVYAVSGLGEAFSGHGARVTLVRPLVRRLLAVAFGHRNSRIIVQNPEDEHLLIQQRVAPAGHTALIRGSGVGLAQYFVRPEPAGTPVVMLAARLIWEKGIQEFVDAARVLKARGVGARFVIVGGTHASNPRAVPAATLHEWEGAGLIEWWGYRADMPEVLAQAHVVCLPSSYGEGVPRVLLEAAACGRAVVATDIPGCRAAIANGVTGLLVPPRDSESLVDAIARLVLDSVERHALAAAGRRRIEAEFDEREVANQTMAVYRALLAAGDSLHGRPQHTTVIHARHGSN